MKADILQILHEEAMTSNHLRPDERVVNSDEFDTVANQIVNLFKDKKYTEEDIVKALFKGFYYCLDNMTEDSSEITQENVQDFINSLD